MEVRDKIPGIVHRDGALGTSRKILLLLFKKKRKDRIQYNYKNINDLFYFVEMSFHRRKRVILAGNKDLAL